MTTQKVSADSTDSAIDANTYYAIRIMVLPAFRLMVQSVEQCEDWYGARKSARIPACIHPNTAKKKGGGETGRALHSYAK
jgi:hypothetical protein